MGMAIVLSASFPHPMGYVAETIGLCKYESQIGWPKSAYDALRFSRFPRSSRPTGEVHERTPEPCARKLRDGGRAHYWRDINLRVRVNFWILAPPRGFKLLMDPFRIRARVTIIHPSLRSRLKTLTFSVSAVACERFYFRKTPTSLKKKNYSPYSTGVLTNRYNSY